MSESERGSYVPSAPSALGGASEGLSTSQGRADAAAPIDRGPCPQWGNDPCVWPRCDCPGGQFDAALSTRPIDEPQASYAPPREVGKDETT
jgi:hypothetical protein